uniref:Uncharacterized protein n=1 Tax=Nelumbo nucifera TaxID=4432 RepID=A0A823A0Q8_NELNU|nr:TPA_asm: hypothetical protein HUJ06_018563 [Nelumbo nucifera]
MLSTGPCEHTAEELECASSHGFRSYGSGCLHENGCGSRYSNGDDALNPRWGSSRVSNEPRKNRSFYRELAPSRSDEIDDWGAAKKTSGFIFGALVGGEKFLEGKEKGF